MTNIVFKKHACLPTLGVPLCDRYESGQNLFVYFVNLQDTCDCSIIVLTTATNSGTAVLLQYKGKDKLLYSAGSSP